MTIIPPNSPQPTYQSMYENLFFFNCFFVCLHETIKILYDYLKKLLIFKIDSMENWSTAQVVEWVKTTNISEYPKSNRN